MKVKSANIAIAAVLLVMSVATVAVAASIEEPVGSDRCGPRSCALKWYNAQQEKE